MRKQQTYNNGIAVTDSIADYSRAKGILLRKGIYQTLGNFGPYYPNKADRIVTHLETFVQEGMEFTIVSSQVISLSLGSLTASKPHIQKEAWFQPVHNPTANC